MIDMEKKYIAFISYRHRFLDSTVAMALHRKIEGYTVPAALRKDGKRHLGRAFRDREELTLGTDLDEKIRNALDESLYLIVVCTRETPNSYWCGQEIDYFLSRYGRENILVVLADGTPESSIPAQLRFEYAKDGTVLRSLEPLCADLVSRSDRLSVKLLTALSRLGDEFLRLAAAMLICSFDDLKQRKRRRNRRMLLTTSAVALTIIGMLTSQNITIRRQNLEISEQKVQIEQQLQQSQLNESQALTLLSKNQRNDGDRRDAISSAYNALYAESGCRPYFAPAVEALSDALLLYQEQEFTEDYRLQLTNTVENIFFSDDGQFAVILERQDMIACMDILQGSILWETKGSLGDKPNVRILPERDQIIVCNPDNVCIFSIKHGTITAEIPTDSGTHILTPSGDTLAVWKSKSKNVEESVISFYDMTVGNGLFRISFDAPVFHMQFLQENTFLLLTGTDTGTQIAVVDYHNETLTDLGDYANFVTASVINDDSVLLLFQEDTHLYNYITISKTGEILEKTAVQYVPQQYGWTTPVIDDEILSVLGDDTWIYMISQNTLYLVYKADGTLIEAIPLPDSVNTSYTDPSYQKKAATAFIDSLGRLNIACENSTIYSYYHTTQFYPDRMIYGNPVQYVDSEGNTIPVHWNRTVLYSNPEVFRSGYVSIVYTETSVFCNLNNADTFMITDNSISDGSGLKVLRILGDTHYTKQLPETSDTSEFITQQRQNCGVFRSVYLTAFQNGVLYWTDAKHDRNHYWEDPTPIEDYAAVVCPYEAQRDHPKVFEEPVSGNSGLAVIANCLNNGKEGFAIYSIPDNQWKFHEATGVTADNICVGQTSKQVAWLQDEILFLYDFESDQTLSKMHLGLVDVSNIQFVLDDNCLVIAEDISRTLVADLQTSQILGEYSMETEFEVSYYPEDLLFQISADSTAYFLSDGYNIGLIIDTETWDIIGRVPSMICYDADTNQIYRCDELRESILAFPFRSVKDTMEIVQQLNPSPTIS